MIGYTLSTQTVSAPHTEQRLCRASGSQKRERAENWSQSLNCSSALGYKISTVDEVNQEPSSSVPNSLLGRAGSAGVIFNPWALMSLRWHHKAGKRRQKGMRDCTTFQTGPQHVSKFLYRGPLLVSSLPGLPINLLIKLAKTEVLEMTLPTEGFPRNRKNIVKPTCNYYVSISVKGETQG